MRELKVRQFICNGCNVEKSETNPTIEAPINWYFIKIHENRESGSSTATYHFCGKDECGDGINNLIAKTVTRQKLNKPHQQ